MPIASEFQAFGIGNIRPARGLTWLSGRPALSVSGTELVGHAACGIAVANIDTSNADAEVLVTTLNGEMLLFPQSGGSLGTPLYWQVTDGALGAYNSICIANLDITNGTKPEVYMATSSGIRKWLAQ